MKNRTKQELKRIVQGALRSEYGFNPSINEIILLEAYMDGSYILFEVNTIEYRFNSNVLSDGSIWIGKGTIEKL